MIQDINCRTITDIITLSFKKILNFSIDFWKCNLLTASYFHKIFWREKNITMHLCIVIEKEKETKEIYVLFDHFKIWPRSYERSGEGSRIRLSPRNRGMFSGLSPFVHYVWIKIICRMFKYSQLVCWLTKWLNKLYIYLIISFEKRQHFRHYKYRSWDWGDLLKNIELPVFS